VRLKREQFKERKRFISKAEKGFENENGLHRTSLFETAEKEQMKEQRMRGWWLSATIGNSPVADLAVQQQQQLPQGLGVAGHSVLFVALDEQVQRLVQLLVGHLEFRVRHLKVLVLFRHLRQLGLEVARVLFLALAEGPLRRSVLRSPSLLGKNWSQKKPTLSEKRGMLTPLVTCCRSDRDGRAASSNDGGGVRNVLSPGEELMSVGVIGN